MTPTRVRSLAGLAVASTFVLTGCGSTPDLNPGVAARVGDETVSVSDVRSIATDYCAAVEANQQAGGAVPNRFVNGLTVSSLGLRSAASQLLAEHDVDLDDSYDTTVAQAEEQQLADLDEGQREAVIAVGAASVYVTAAELSVGREVLGGDPSDEEAQAAGADELVAWMDDHDVRLDPKFGVSIDTGEAVITDTQLSYALSDTATAGQAEEPDNEAAALLPETQRCG